MARKVVFGYFLWKYAQRIVFCKENNTLFLETLSSLHNSVGKVASFLIPHVVHSLHEGNQFLNKVI